MKRYWDHTESERAKLTAEQVEKLLDYELMEKGVLQVEPLKLEEEQPVPLPTRRAFMLREVDGTYASQLLGFAFESIGKAEACRDALEFIREQDGWQGPHFTRPVKQIEIVAEDLPTKDAVVAARVPLAEQQRRATANATAKREHEEACKKVAEATADVWSDWRACQEAEARHERVRKTLAEYLAMTDGNDVLARAFLAKVFPPDEIVAAVGEPPVKAACAVDWPV
jgi:hypothetical protein